MDVLNHEEQKPANFIREGVKIGVINGVIALLLMYGSYYAGLDVFVSVQLYANFIPYMMIILIIYGFQLRSKNEGYLSFKEGLQYSFMSYVIVALLLAVGTYILFIVIDPGLTQRAFDFSVKKNKLEKVIDKNVIQKTTLGTIIVGIGYSLILNFIASLIVSVIIRREKPVL